MHSPSFSLNNVPKLLGSPYVPSQKSTIHLSQGGRRAVPPKSSASRLARIQNWAAEHRKTIPHEAFSALLDGGQVGAELVDIFRETPEFGRSLAIRVAGLLDESTEGSLNLIGAGGEAIVFYDPGTQQVVKLFAPPCKAKFGWIPHKDSSGMVSIRPVELDEALLRFAWFESLFPTGLEIDSIGSESDFLLLRQPFIAGEHPSFDELRAWMRARGWRPAQLQTDLSVIRDLTWMKDDWLIRMSGLKMQSYRDLMVN